MFLKTIFVYLQKVRKYLINEYNKGREFFYVINKQVAPGVIFYSQDKKTYKYWEIGILDIK